MVKVFDEVIAILRQGWTKGCMARDANGQHTEFDGPDATCWCALGAFYASKADLGDVEAAKDRLRSVISNYSIAGWNDGCQSVEEVVAALERARDS